LELFYLPRDVSENWWHFITIENGKCLLKNELSVGFFQPDFLLAVDSYDFYIIIFPLDDISFFDQFISP
jgi:hypothetical protein